MSGSGKVEQKKPGSKKLVDNLFKVVQAKEYKGLDDSSDLISTSSQLFKVLRAEALLSEYSKQFDKEYYKIAYGIMGVLKSIFSESYSLEELKQMNACRKSLDVIGGDLEECKCQLADKLPEEAGAVSSPEFMQTFNNVVEVSNLTVWLLIALDEVLAEKLQLERSHGDGVESVLAHP